MCSGPDKLPHLARQLGAAWGDLRRFRTRLESDVRGAFPDLPPTREVAQAVRSPLAFLDRLADEHEKSLGTSSEAADGPPSTGSPPSTLERRQRGNGTHPVDAPPAASEGAGAQAWGPEAGVPDDPNMN